MNIPSEITTLSSSKLWFFRSFC